MSGANEHYIARAIEGEVIVVANAPSSTRNYSLNRSAFKLGTIPGLATDTAVNALMLAAGANGYVKEHGVAATRKVIDSGLRNGQRNLRAVALPRPPGNLTTAAQVTANAPVIAKPEATDSLVSDSAEAALPSRTLPDETGKPTFRLWDENGPAARSNEKRRHFYTLGNVRVRLKILNHGEGGVSWYRVVDDKGRLGWQSAKPGGYREVAYTGGTDPRDREALDDDIYCPEGEKDVDTCVRIGLLAATFGGTGDGMPAEFVTYFTARNVIVLSDNDQGGREHAEKKAALLAPIAKSVRIVHFADTPEKGDVSDWIETGHSVDDLLYRVKTTPAWISSAAPVVSPPIKFTPTLDVVCMADIQPTSIEYLWPNWLAIGKVHVLAGEGGKGKTTLLHDWTARTSRGYQWPDGAAGGSPGGVLILASEDDVEDTIAPRLLAAGADMTRVFVIRSVSDENQRRRGFNLQADLEKLEAEIKARDNIRLVIFDPISSYLGRIDSHNNSDVRSVLDPLGEFASRMRVAVVCNNHFSKGGGGANSRIIGSVAFVNQARAAFIVTPDEQDETRMLLIPSKMNIAPLNHGLAYRIEGCLIDHGVISISTSRIMYESAPITITANEALAALNGNDDAKSAKAEAIDFLLGALKAGAVSAKDIKRDASEAGISPKSLRSAREALGIKPEKAGFDDGWVWYLPKMPSEVQDARD